MLNETGYILPEIAYLPMIGEEGGETAKNTLT
jgi:hypothetical protein